MLVLIGVCALALVACASRRSEIDYARLGNPKNEEYVIGNADVLKVTVWKLPEVNSDVRVRPDGTITLPLVGDVSAAALTPTQLSAEIRARLSKYVKSDDGTAVTVAVSEVNSYYVTVSGKVNKQGLFPLKDYVKVSEAIALAGGPSVYANPDETIVVRTWKSKRPKRIPIEYGKIQQGLTPEQDIVLYRGDVVYVP